MVAGTSSTRMTVASTSSATIMPTPISLMNVMPEAENAPTTMISSRARLVIRPPPVRCRPLATAAVAGGLQRTGGIITSLALLLVIVVGAFSASGITFIKLMGVGMIIALVVDATIIRVLLVPATMRLLGRANWWAPRPLRRLYARYGIKEEIPELAPVAAGVEG